MTRLSIIILVIILSSCSPFEFWDIDKFKITPSALSDGEEVTLLYYSNSPSGGEFYTHALVKSNLTGDTVNVLTFPSPDLSEHSFYDLVRVYNSKPDIKSELGKFKNIPDSIKNELSGVVPPKISWKKHNKVVRDPEFDFLADNQFKTVIGTLKMK